MVFATSQWDHSDSVSDTRLLRMCKILTEVADILFSNVKHLFFQPCDHELLVIVHMHLRAPIMIGKKKTFDVQFFREATDVQFDETGNRKRKHRYGDEDEIEMEQQERKRRAMLNKEVKAFAEKIAEAASNSVRFCCVMLWFAYVNVLCSLARRNP